LDPDTILDHINGLKIAKKWAPTEEAKETINAHIKGLEIALKYAGRKI
jgi:hypothetical protein